MKTVLVLLAVPALFLSACGDGDEDTGAEPTGTTTSIHTSSPTRSAGATPTSNLDEVCANNPDPATEETTQVDEPVAGDSVSSPLTVRGSVAAFEATFRITLFDADKNILAEVVGMSSEGQTLAPFAEDVSFSVTEETPACLWVYEASARDGLPIHVVQIPLILQP